MFLQLKCFGIEINHQKVFITSLILVLGNYSFRILEPVVMGSSLLALNIDPFNNPHINNTAMMDEILTGILVSVNVSSYMNYVAFYIVLLFATYSRMAAINECLRKQKFIMPSKHCDIVREMAILHDKVCRIAELINECFAFNLINFLLYFVFDLILFSFGVYNHSSTPNAPIEQVIMNIITLQWIVYYFVGVFWTIVIASWIKSEGKMTVQLLHELTIHNNDVKLLSAVQLSTMQIVHRQPTISVGLFNIDFELTTLMIGAVFSYTIILVQFESS